MWHALRAELAYCRPWLLGGLGLAAGVVALVSLIFVAVGEHGPERHVAAFLRGMFMIMAPMIVGYVAHGIRFEERRACLLLLGPLTPRQLAGAMVLLPVVLFAIGVLAAGLVMGTEALVTGKLELESVHIVGYVGGLMLGVGLMVLLGQEAVAAHGQRRLRAAAAGWAGFVVAVLAWAALTTMAVLVQGPLTWASLHLGNLLVAVTAMAASAALYAGRTDFTR